MLEPTQYRVADDLHLIKALPTANSEALLRWLAREDQGWPAAAGRGKWFSCPRASPKESW